MDLALAIIALAITLAGHLGVTVWWASRMDTNVKHAVQSLNALVEQGANHGATLAKHDTRLTVLERLVPPPSHD